MADVLKQRGSYEALTRDGRYLWTTADGRYRIAQGRDRRGDVVFGLYDRQGNRVAEHCRTLDEARDALVWNRDADATGGPDG